MSKILRRRGMGEKKVFIVAGTDRGEQRGEKKREGRKIRAKMQEKAMVVKFAGHEERRGENEVREECGRATTTTEQSLSEGRVIVEERRGDMREGKKQGRKLL